MSPIARSNADVPREAQAGNPPEAEPRFGHLLAEAWRTVDQATPHEQSRTDVPRYVRLGWAGQCARLIGYRLTDTPESNPTDLAGYWRMNVGSMIHDLMETVVPAAFPGAKVEKLIGAEYDEMFGFPVSGRADLFLVAEDGKRTLVEYKTVGGFKFKSQIGERGTAEGPDATALHQAALYGRAFNADEVVIVSLSLECLSANALDKVVKKQGGEAHDFRKFVAEWRYKMSDLDELVDREIARLKKITTMVDARAAWLVEVEDASMDPAEHRDEPPLPPRSIPFTMPPRARVTDPMKGTWRLEIDGNILEAGTAWQCASYCSHRDQCATDGPS